MAGVPDDTASVSIFAGVPLLSTIQLLLAAVSPNIKPPMLRAVSRWTVLSAVISSVLKSAVASVPLAMLPPDQFAELDHEPPEVVSIQTLTVAEAAVFK